jgi:tRNA (guanine26-N2/guanine27-N2)-dimethyltransferase
MFRTIREGRARISVPVGEKISRRLEVFYNPVMKFNRDTSVLLLRALGRKNMAIADPLAASGIRSIRFALELGNGAIRALHANDGSRKAALNFRKNLRLNGLEKDGRISVSCREANLFLVEKGPFDYIDIDPFGSPSPFLDGAFRSIRRNGIVAVTATDTGSLAGAFPKAGIRKYWAMPLKTEFMHETGLRILTRKVQLVSAQYDKIAVPVMSFYRDHYYRIFFAVRDGAGPADNALSQHGYVLYCRKCLWRRVSAENSGKCENCGSKAEAGGPMWIGKLGDEKLVEKMMAKCSDEKAADKTTAFLRLLAGEYASSAVGFYDVHKVCKVHGIKDIPRKAALLERLRKKDRTACATHISGTGIRTTMGIMEFARLLKTS